MQASKPRIEVLGDNESYGGDKSRPWLRPHIMARCGECIGMSNDEAVWRFGFSPESEAAQAYGVCIPMQGEEWPGFLWVRATRKEANVKETFIGYAIELPKSFRKVIQE